MSYSTLHEPLVIRQQELSSGTSQRHMPHHYELLIVRSGTGNQLINDSRLPYQAGDVILIFPEDIHCLEVQQHTQWQRIAFTPVYLADLMTTSGQQWTSLGARPSAQPVRFAANPAGQRHIAALTDILFAEVQPTNDRLVNPVVNLLMTTVLSLTDRLLAQQVAVCPPQASPLLIKRVIGYVSQHITEPDHLRIEKMADVFNYSPGHLGALFKKHAGESIQQYIIRHRLRLVKTRLTLSSMTVSQIADEFGFSDVCHLNKLFKRYYHDTPTNYRRCQISQ
ncbi:AraC family transcriptional regulator [Arsenicibacter rosenii]|uniref:HTH araC/xylS-type domain-containing protein n=1 Tax=Arsenicibacter rosenii TaxID=1750698 RepID=A0A1S2VB24_9BACT|nr:AraC family transcriptional regulator [Arsenicibacter rosenii]OIN55921.1 hypothetical protein BLX24_27615 [Arsenicibacter rosenii]